MLFRFEDVYKAYGPEEILCGVTFQVNPAEKVGLVGRNGAGKTTLFRLLLEQEHPDKGQIMRASRLSIGLLAQKHRFVTGTTVLETALSVFTNLQEIEARMQQLETAMTNLVGDALEETLTKYSELQHSYEMQGGFTTQARAQAVLLGLGFTKDQFSLSTTHLSGGQQSRLSLAMLLLSEPDILLLDEPTNHLDISAIEWLEEFLRNYKSAYVIISHDRFMLDQVTDRIIDLERGRTTSYPGNFSFYLAEREERRKAQQNAYEQQQAMIERTEEFIRRNLAGQKTKQAKSRRKMLEKLDRIDAVQAQEMTASFNIKPIARTGDQVLVAENLAVGYDTKCLADKISFTLRRGEVLAIIGGNGTGKTTMLRTLLGRQPALAGQARWGANVKVGYYDQQLTELSPEDRVIDALRALDPYVEDVKLRSFLGTFNFRGDEIYKSIRDLSGGEHGRLTLARLVYSQVNVLVLDEPTNHLDIASRESLEAALDDFVGTILVVSHDRYFLDKLATEIIYLDGKSAELFSGTYSEYCELRQQRIEAEQQQRAQAVKVARVEAKSVKPKNRAPQLREPAIIEHEIGETESIITKLSQDLASVEVARVPERLMQLQKEYDEFNNQLEALYQEWEISMQGIEQGSKS